MEWIKRMSLKKALFTITFLNLVTALLLSGAAFLGCGELGKSVAKQGVEIDIYARPVKITERPDPTKQERRLMDFFAVLQIILPVLIFIAALIITVVLFYRWKLKEPLGILTDGAARIMDNDLDFSVEVKSSDELGQLCAAFETMRQSLLENNRRLWRQAEERKRLNAAFSHDLRNPITVLNGSVKMAKQCVEQEELLTENLLRIENYAGRIERYVETMSTVQRLEQVQVEKVPADSRVIIEELKKTISFVVSDSGKQLVFQDQTIQDQIRNNCDRAVPAHILIDQGILMQIIENLVSNAVRFARQTVSVVVWIEEGTLTVTVKDDGTGFPEKLLKNGIQPFQKGNEDAEHFGMGLYICDLLCKKHGGKLHIKNDSFGAAVSALLKIS